MSEEQKERMPVKGETVIVVDSFGKKHDGLVTNCWNKTINAVYVTKDDTKTDSYGNQIERQTSCVHKSLQAAPGYYWYFPGETF